MRRVSFVVTLLLLVFGVVDASEGEKVVIIGFDGADARLVQQWMDAGELPHLAQLRDEGQFSPLLPTNPPQTPVSWSSFATGIDPGRTEIFDFLKRDPSNYLPDFAMMSETRKTFITGPRNGLVVGLGVGAATLLLLLLLQLAVSWKWRTRLALGLLLGLGAGLASGYMAATLLPVEVPDATNNRQGRTMWELASEAGRKAVVIRVPATFPAEPVEGGHMLSGLGVPDMRGRIGTPSFYTSDPQFDVGANEFSLEGIRLPANSGTIRTKVVGPWNKPFYDYVVDRETHGIQQRSELAAARERVRQRLDDAGIERRIDLPLEIEVSKPTLTVRVSGQSATLRVGEWSDWIRLDFPVNGLVDRVAPLTGIARFKLLKLEPEIELYLSPIAFHPDCHPVAFSWPPDYSEELEDRFGLFKTLGWALDTWSLPEGVGDEELFLEDMQFTVDKYEEMMVGLLGDEDSDLFVQIFYFTDRIGHLLWQYLDPEHPIHDAQRAPHYRAEMLSAYKRMDDLVGKARELAGPDAFFMVLSDHGFSSFRRGVNLNNWLIENELMVLKNQPSGAATLEDLFDTQDLAGDVDWSKTKAYAMGLGSIYVNLVGREAQGIVLPGPEYDAVVERIRVGLEGLVDEATGDHPISRVWTRDEMYSDYAPDLIPDLRAGNSLGYRVSWQTSLMGFGDGLIEDNTKAWSGDHCSNDPALVPGILFTNRPLNTEQPRMIDVMPTVMQRLGLELPEGLDGRPLL